MSTRRPYLLRTHVYRQLEPQHVELELPVRPFALVALDEHERPHWVDHTKRYRQEDLERLATEGRLYLVHATRWTPADEPTPLHPTTHQP